MFVHCFMVTVIFVMTLHAYVPNNKAVQHFNYVYSVRN